MHVLGEKNMKDTNNLCTKNSNSVILGLEDDSRMGRRKQQRRTKGLGSVVLRGNVWYCRWTDALGNRKEVSSHTSNKDEALRTLATYTESIRKSQSEDEIKLRLSQQLEVMELRKDIKSIERISIGEITTKFLNHRELMDATKGTLNTYRKQLKKLTDTISTKFPNVKYMDGVSGVVVEEVMDALSRHYTPSSFNLALATYKRCWNLLARGSNPFTKVSKRKIDKSRHRMKIDDDDVRRIFNACRNDVERAVWACGIYLGLRCGDICNLTYGALSHDLSTVTCLPMKTKRHMTEPLMIPICEPLKKMLMLALDMNKIGNAQFKDEPLWEIWKERYNTNKAHVNFGVTLKKSGLSVSHKDENGHVAVDTGFHITRRAFVSFASRYLSPLLVQKIVGHSTLKQTAHYCDYDIESVRSGLNQMPDFSNGGSSKLDDTSEILKLLNEVKNDDESALDCLKRLLEKSMRVAS